MSLGTVRLSSFFFATTPDLDVKSQRSSGASGEPRVMVTVSGMATRQRRLSPSTHSDFSTHSQP